VKDDQLMLLEVDSEDADAVDAVVVETVTVVMARAVVVVVVAAAVVVVTPARRPRGSPLPSLVVWFNKERSNHSKKFSCSLWRLKNIKSLITSLANH